MTKKPKPVRARVATRSHLPHDEHLPTEIKVYVAQRDRHADGTVDREAVSIDLRRRGLEVDFYMSIAQLKELRTKIDEAITKLEDEIAPCTRSICCNCKRGPRYEAQASTEPAP